MTTPISPATQTLPLGALVRYHGSIASEHGNLFYVAAEAAGRYLLIDRDYPNVTTLRGVHRHSVIPTGEAVDMCDCGHQAGIAWPERSYGHCELRGCDCRNHFEERTEADAAPPTTATVHKTRTVLDAYQVERYKTKSNGSCGRHVRSDTSVALCSCGWKYHAGSRAEARGAARAHRIEAEAA